MKADLLTRLRQWSEKPNEGNPIIDAMAGDLQEALEFIEAIEGWLPIEAVPKNRAVQIHVPSLDYYGNGGVYAGMLVDMGTGPRWMTFGWAIGRDLGHENTPDAWRPLPPPPHAFPLLPTPAGAR